MSIIFSATLVMLLIGCEQSEELAKMGVEEPISNDSPVDVPQRSAKETSEETKKQTQNVSTPETEQVEVDFSAFQDAALAGDGRKVQQAIDGGIDVNQADDQQRTALMLAAFNGHTPIVKLLLDDGAELDHRDALGRTALMFAATADNGETVELLIDAGADVNAVDTGEGFTSLMHAAAEGQLKVVQILLKHQADPTIRDVDGDTALDFATQNGHTDVVNLLTQ
ncbi:ankyrin repeat domain-containing protein [Bythopirellula goksoeyrii]|nr:ankyrin repeat domain-containing protein [Bythopirellula goksoeyrii]